MSARKKKPMPKEGTEEYRQLAEKGELTGPHETKWDNSDTQFYNYRVTYIDLWTRHHYGWELPVDMLQIRRLNNAGFGHPDEWIYDLFSRCPYDNDYARLSAMYPAAGVEWPKTRSRVQVEKVEDTTTGEVVYREDAHCKPEKINLNRALKTFPPPTPTENKWKQTS